MPVAIPLVVLTFPVVFLLVRVAVGMLNDVASTDSVPNGATTSPQAATPAKPVIDSGTADLLGLLFATGAAGSLAKDAWGRRSSTEAWRIGAEGEERTARSLDRLGRRYRVLHDARVPGRRSNIDHVVVGPTGVLTIETKNYAGKVRISRSLFASEPVVEHGGRRLDRVIDQASGQAEAVGELVRSSSRRSGIYVQPVVVVQRAQLDVAPFIRPVTRGVRWCSGRRLVRVIRNGPASLSAEEVASIAAALERVLLPTAPARRPTSAPVPEPTTSAHSAGPRIPDGAGTAAGATPARTGTATGPGTPTHTGPTCRCGAQMVMRRRRRDGAPFYGCSTFPACRQTKPI